VQRLGACVAYDLHSMRPRNGGEAMASADSLIDSLLHIFFVNRRILITPFQGMALVSPQTSEADADRHTRVFDEFATFYKTALAV
jgi:glutamate-1-semialdehyde 2,1-aminomutase